MVPECFVIGQAVELNQDRYNFNMELIVKKGDKGIITEFDGHSRVWVDFGGKTICLYSHLLNRLEVE